MEEFPRAQFDPITGLCIVANSQSCPLGYRCIDKSYDQQADADLWKDSFLGKKERFLCITRFFPLDHGKLNNVMDSISVINEKDSVPNGFAVVDATYDSKEKAMKKKLLVVKMVPRFSVPDAICELIILSRMRKAPEGFTVFGEIGGLLLCFRKGPVPPASVKSVSPAPPGPYLLQQKDLHAVTDKPPARTSDSGRRAAPAAPNQSSVAAQTGASLARQMSRTLRLGTSNASSYKTVEDVPFRISNQYTYLTSQNSNITSPSVRILSPEEILHQFDYDFSQEKAYLASTNETRTANGTHGRRS